ncbi:MAG: hypothetical protein A2017_03250 [Lentisphaerae bacterium GWF2_44_16]|nr:MAG: hypothetical protein A2017_03250 [Lentisphaerae bacterium GWF2_44_16]
MFSIFFSKFTAVLLCLFLSSLSISAQTRVAILGDIERNRAEIDCLVERLSKGPGIVMVERSEIDKIIAEQKFSLFSDEAAAVKIGTMLGAQAVIVIKSFQWEGKDILSARLVATDSGAILGVWTQDTPSKEAFHFADAVKFEFEPLFSKLKLDRNEISALSILDIRAAVDSPESKELERKITLLLSQRLMYEKSFVVLERWRLGNIAWEKELNLDNNPFWTGSCMLDGSVESLHDGKGTVKVTLRLRKPGKKSPEMMEFSGSTLDLKGLVESMVAPLSEKLGIKSMADTKIVWDMKKEAEFYFSEAQWLLRAGSFERAREASDAANALGKTGPVIDFLRIKSYLGELGYTGEEEKQEKRGRTKNKKAIKSLEVESSEIVLMENLDKLSMALDIYIKFVEAGPQSLPGHFYGERDWRSLGNDLLRASAVLLKSSLPLAADGQKTKLREKVSLVCLLSRKAAALTMDKGDNSSTIIKCYFTYLNSLIDLLFEKPEERLAEYRRILSREFPLQPEMHYNILMVMNRKKMLNERQVQRGSRSAASNVLLDRLAKQMEVSGTSRGKIDALLLAGKKASSEDISNALWKYRDQLIDGSGRMGDCPEALLFSDNYSRDIIAKLLLYAFSRSHIIVGEKVNILLGCFFRQNAMMGKDEALNRKIAEAWYNYYRYMGTVLDTVQTVSYNEIIRERIAKLSDYRPEKNSHSEFPVLSPVMSSSLAALCPQGSAPYFQTEDMGFSSGCLQISGSFSRGNKNLRSGKAYLIYYLEDGPKPYFVEAPASVGFQVPDIAASGYFPFQTIRAGIMLKAGDDIYYSSHDGKVSVMGKNGEWRELKDSGFQKVTAMAFSRGSLYLSYGHLFNDKLYVSNGKVRTRDDAGANTIPAAIVRIDIKNGDMELLASSRRNPPLSPLDNCPPWYAVSLTCSDNGILASRVITRDSRTYNSGNTRAYYSGLYEMNIAKKKWKCCCRRDTNGISSDFGFSGNIQFQFREGYFVFDMKNGSLKKVNSAPLGDFTNNEEQDPAYNNYRLFVITTDNGEKLFRITQLDENFFEIKALGMGDGKLSGLKFTVDPKFLSKDCKFLRGFAVSDKLAYILLGTSQSGIVSDASILALDLNSFLKPMMSVETKKKKAETRLTVFEPLSKVPENLKPGVVFNFYKGVWPMHLPNLLLMTPTATEVLGNMKVPALDWSEHASFMFKGYFKAEKEGKYPFHISGRSSCVVHIDENPPKFIPRTYGRAPRVVEEMILKPGLHSIRVDIWTDTPEEKLEVTVKVPGEEKYKPVDGLVFYTDDKGGN